MKEEFKEKLKHEEDEKEIIEMKKDPFCYTFSNDLICFETVDFPKDDQKRIHGIIERKQPISIRDVCRLNFQIGKLFGNAILETIKRNNSLITLEDIDLISSHGLTVWHECEEETGKVHSTLQIGEPDVICAITKKTVVSDFRTLDVAFGGCGAPLTSIQDALMAKSIVGSNNYYKAIHNIGGISNVSFVNLSGTNKEMICFDCGPGNCIMDTAMRILENKNYDENGKLASKGIINHKIVNSFLSHKYFQQKPPKTTGRELFNRKSIEELIEKCKENEMNNADILATFCEITVESIFRSYSSFGPKNIKEIELNGGGSQNRFLVERLKKKFGKDIKIIVPSKIETEAKEGKLFALLGYLNSKGMYSNLPSVTGARRRCVLGKRSFFS